MTVYVSAMFPLKITEGAAGFDQIEKEDLVALISSHLEMVLYTRQGEIISDIGFGIGIENYLFALQNEQSVLSLESTVKRQVKKYMPYLTNFSVFVDRSKISRNTLGLRIEYSVDNLDINEVSEFIILP